MRPLPFATAFPQGISGSFGATRLTPGANGVKPGGGAYTAGLGALE